VSGAGSRRHRTGLVHAKPKKLDDVRSDINVTPLVDVCLVLLIIFMVVTPMLSRGKDVPLPKTHNHKEKKDLGEQPILSVALVGGKPAYYFDKDRMEDRTDQTALQQITKRTEAELSKKASKGVTSIFVKADANMKFGQVYPALIAVHEGGSQGVELGTNENKEQK
jgi:biopolymer transport protein ExbD